MDGWNTIVSFWGPAYFQGRAVSFWEGIYFMTIFFQFLFHASLVEAQKVKPMVVVGVETETWR